MPSPGRSGTGLPRPSVSRRCRGILQGFRVVGSGSKLGRDYPVVAYRFGDAVDLEKLLDYIPDSNGEQQRIQALMKKSRLSLAEAKEKYPDWYERRIVKKERRGRWTVKRDLYDWWLHRIADEIRVGHRFYGIMTLAIYAKKCGIDEDELREDAFGLLERYDDMSVEDINRFTRDDIVCALEMFNEDYVTFPRDDIAKLSGMTMPVNKRNWRKRSDHVRVMNTMKSLKKQLGEAVNEGRPKGSGTAKKKRCVSGGSSTRTGAKQIAIGILDLIPRQSESGGMIFPPCEIEKT